MSPGPATSVVKFDLTADERRAVDGMLRLVQAQKAVNRQAVKGNKANNLFTKGLNSGLKGNIRGLGRMAAGFVSVTAAITVGRKAWQLFQDDIKGGSAAIKKFQNDFLQLQFLGQNFRDKGLRQRTLAFATASGIDPSEVALGANALKSMTGTLPGTEAQKRAARGRMLSEMAKLRKTTPATLSELVPTFAKMRSIFPTVTARGQANITSLMIEQAAVTDVRELAPVTPTMFSAGRVGGMDVRTTAALGAFMTAKSGSAGKAATAMKMISTKLMLKDAGEAEAIRNLAFGETDPTAGRKNVMQRAGITPGDTAYQRLLKLAALNRTSPLSVQAKADIVGPRRVAQLNDILTDPEGLRAMVTRFKTQTGPGQDIVGRKLGLVGATDPTFGAVAAGQRGSAAIVAAKQDVNNVYWTNFGQSLERIRRETGGGFGSFLDLGMAMRKAEVQNVFGASVRENLTQNLGNALRNYGYVDQTLPFNEKNAAAREMAERWLGITTNMEETAKSMKEAAEAVFKAPKLDAHVSGDTE